ncbi:MAG: BACON domain-containing protein, partial [Syntrophales bacterium]|nr:BACON domain-containing protein [Syntrophales bacterium]
MRTITTSGHPPGTFNFVTGQESLEDHHFAITGYQGNNPPYSAYGWLSSGVSILDLGTKNLSQVTGVPATGFQTPDSISLTPGHAYAFKLAHNTIGVIAVNSVNVVMSTVTMVFEYLYPLGGSGPTISFSGGVKGFPNWPATEGAAGISGLTVEARNAANGQLINQAVTGADGAFTITGIPGAPATFYISIPGSENRVPIVSKYMSWNENIQALLPFAAFTPTQYSAFGNTSGTGMILGRVTRQDNPTQFLSGATVTARAWEPGNPPTLGETYPVTYTGGGNTTGADGIYMVKNVPSGKLVQLVADLPGYTFAFNAAVVPVQAGTVTEESFFGNPAGGGSCTYTVAPPAVNHPAGGASGTLTVTAPDGCAWTAVSNNTSWLQVTAGASGSGNGTVNYTVAANAGAARVGSVTVAGQTVAILQGGTTTIDHPVVGVWGAAWLQYENSPKIWYTEATRATFFPYGTGVLQGIKNDGINDPGQRIKPFQTAFTYTVGTNPDGSSKLTVYGNGIEEGAQEFRAVIEPNGTMGIIDGTYDPAWETLRLLVNINPNKTYSNADVAGEYYYLGFERNVDNAGDPPNNGNGTYMVISGVATFNATNGTFSDYWTANSVKLDGSNYIWTGNDANIPYSVGATGNIWIGAANKFAGAVAGNGLFFGGAGSFQGNNWWSYVFLKKGDRSYTTADLAGKWALVSFGQDNQSPSSPSLLAQIGTLTCNTAGACSYKLRERSSDGTVRINTGNVNLTVNNDGSFGASLGTGFPNYAGAMGNDGNTLVFNTGLKISEPQHREIFVGVRADTIGDLAGDLPTNNLLTNGTFAGNLDGWVVNPVLQTGTQPWTPLLPDGSVSLHPPASSFNGTILYQNLNLTEVAGKTFTVSAKLTKVSAPDGKTVAAWLTYVDNSGTLQRVKVLNPANGDITTGTTASANFTAPTGAQRIVKFELTKENYGDFNADDVVLWACLLYTSP